MKKNIIMVKQTPYGTTGTQRNSPQNRKLKVVVSQLHHNLTARVCQRSVIIGKEEAQLQGRKLQTIGTCRKFYLKPEKNYQKIQGQ